jgi:hypothetical protein
LKGAEILLEANQHDVVVGGGRNDEEFLFLCSEMLMDIFRILKRDEAILFAMNDQRGEEYLFNPLQTFLINPF